ncbi:MAG: hypothetical protein AAF598_07980 [Bacteroidota bacterium]
MNALVMLLMSLMMSAPQPMVPTDGNCPGWGTGQDSLTNIKNHVLYRDYLKSKDFENALPFWEAVYADAPAASIKHFNDGIRIYRHFYDNETNDTIKAEYAQKILDIYDDRINCMGKEGFVLGRKSFDMFYRLDMAYDEAYPVGKRSIDLQGLKSESSALYPVAYMAVELFKEDSAMVSKEEAVELYETFQKIVDHNLATQKKEKERTNYQKAWEAIEAKYYEVSLQLFDCAYFEVKERPQLDSVWNDLDGMKKMIQRLAQGGCEESSGLVNTLLERYESVSDSIDVVSRTASGWVYFHLREKNLDAAQDSFPSAEATETDQEKMYDLSMRLAKATYAIQKNKSKARQYARKAIQYNPNSADAYYLIGEMYASSGPDCGPGTGWDSQRVVWPAIDKWNQAIKADPNSEAAKKARQKINQYTQYMPTVEQIFQKNLKEGQTYKVPCWIQENTKIRGYNPF